MQKVLCCDEDNIDPNCDLIMMKTTTTRDLSDVFTLPFHGILLIVKENLYMKLSRYKIIFEENNK